MSKNKSKPLYPASIPYTQIPDGLWLSPEFNSMTPHSRCIYMIMLAKWEPHLPEKTFALTYDDIQNVTCFNRQRISKSISELRSKGFIKVPRKGTFPHNVTMYAINFEWIEKKYTTLHKAVPEYLDHFLGREGINSYSKSSWRAIRKKVLARDCHKCTKCGNSERLQVHHLTYDNKGHEGMDDLITLCRKCHLIEHRRLKD